MCSEPVTRTPASGFPAAYLFRIDIRPGISCSAMVISLRPQSASAMSATLYFKSVTSSVDRHAPGQVRVFAVGLHAAAPARIAHQVDVRRPEGEALVHAPLAAPLELVVLGASLVGDGRGHAENESGIPRRGQA